LQGSELDTSSRGWIRLPDTCTCSASTLPACPWAPATRSMPRALRTETWTSRQRTKAGPSSSTSCWMACAPRYAFAPSTVFLNRRPAVTHPRGQTGLCLHTNHHQRRGSCGARRRRTIGSRCTGCTCCTAGRRRGRRATRSSLPSSRSPTCRRSRGRGT